MWAILCWIKKISYATISLAWNCPRAKNKLIFPGRERKPPVISYQDVPESNAITGAEKQSTGVCDSMKKQVSSPVLSKAGGDSKLNEVAVQIKTKLLELFNEAHREIRRMQQYLEGIVSKIQEEAFSKTLAEYIPNAANLSRYSGGEVSILRFHVKSAKSKSSKVLMQKVLKFKKSYFTKRLKVQNYRGLVKLSIVGLG